LLAKSTPSLEAIRKLEGRNRDQLVSLRSQLSGGAERLQRAHTEYLRDVHERLISAWRFAENAARRDSTPSRPPIRRGGEGLLVGGRC
jgi:hypothetical protein